jgi:glycosyltransferase involved in cell wall biosynthesis
MPRVSVIIPTYNDATYLPVAIESVLAQSCQDFELIVIDDGSTDNTRTVLQSYLARIRYIYQENQGESVARNQGIRLAQGEYVAFLDSDDVWLPAKLARQVEIMAAHPQGVLLYTDSYLTDAAGKEIGYLGCGTPGSAAMVRDMARDLVIDNVVMSASTVMVRRAALAGLELFDAAIQWGEDWDLWIRLALRGPMVYLPEPLACYRMRKPGRRLQIEASEEFVRQNALVLRKVFDHLPESHAALRQSEPDAFAALYLRSAFNNFMLNDTERGTRYLAEAFQADGRLLRERSAAFARLVADKGFSVGEEHGNLSDGITFVTNTFDHLPAMATPLRPRRAQALGEIYAAAAFRAFGAVNYPDTWRYVGKAIWLYPPMVTNRGLLSIGGRALVARPAGIKAFQH